MKLNTHLGFGNFALCNSTHSCPCYSFHIFNMGKQDKQQDKKKNSRKGNTLPKYKYLAKSTLAPYPNEDGVPMCVIIESGNTNVI